MPLQAVIKVNRSLSSIMNSFTGGVPLEQLGQKLSSTTGSPFAVRTGVKCRKIKDSKCLENISHGFLICRPFQGVLARAVSGPCCRLIIFLMFWGVGWGGMLSIALVVVSCHNLNLDKYKVVRGICTACHFLLPLHRGNHSGPSLPATVPHRQTQLFLSRLSQRMHPRCVCGHARDAGALGEVCHNGHGALFCGIRHALPAVAPRQQPPLPLDAGEIPRQRLRPFFPPRGEERKGGGRLLPASH